ncbi:hypothetical protein [Ferrovibrio sp.]|uniref:hypothetical protein n=1 Tax=Ferrovibrio sp. TaxID=1917215 RepID=UPI00311FBB95
MINRGPDYLRQMVNKVLDAMLQGVVAQAKKGPLTPEQVARLIEAMKSAPDYDHFYRASYAALLKLDEDDQKRGARINAFGRLLVHPLDTLFAENKLDRRLIGNFFFFVRSLFGDEVDAMAEEAAAIADTLREADGNLEWPRFYADTRVKQIYFRVIVRLMRAFRSFDARRDWTMKVMQHDPTAVGLSSTVYIERPFEGQPLPFGDREFYLFFSGLVRPLVKLSVEDAKLFQETTGEKALHVAGNFLERLDEYRPKVA